MVKKQSVFNEANELTRASFIAISCHQRPKFHAYKSIFADENNKWFDDNSISINIKQGNNYFDNFGNLETAKNDEDIYLNTISGQATFKKWFEDIVIPNLKKGLEEEKSDDIKLRLKKNRFIQSL